MIYIAGWLLIFGVSLLIFAPIGFVMISDHRLSLVEGIIAILQASIILAFFIYIYQLD